MPRRELDRRRVERFPLHSHGYAMFGENRIDLKTHDISLDGCLIELSSHEFAAEGAKFDICLEIGFVGKACIRRISERDGKRLFGVKFDRFEFASALLH